MKYAIENAIETYAGSRARMIDTGFTIICPRCKRLLRVYNSETYKSVFFVVRHRASHKRKAGCGLTSKSPSLMGESLCVLGISLRDEDLAMLEIAK